MNKITAIIIAKNAEDIIADCLESISFCDEIIVIDNDSSDRTGDIAKKIGVKVFAYKARNFSDLRNHGLEKAAGDWILYIDTDERVTSELARNIKDVISKPEKNFTAYRLNRKNFYLGNHEWPKVEKLARFFKRKALKKWEGELHESPVFEGKERELDGFLLHYTHQNLTAMLAKTIEWSKVEAQLRFDSNHPKMIWWRFPRVMISTFFDYYIRQEGWRVGTAGLIESLYQSFSIFITYARLWEMQNGKIKKTN